MARWRSTFSTTTMASSTTMPIASTSPNRDRLFSENCAAFITAKVPTSETGIATSGMIALRQLCRKMITTSATSPSAMNSVLFTSSIDDCT